MNEAGIESLSRITFKTDTGGVLISFKKATFGGDRSRFAFQEIAAGRVLKVCYSSEQGSANWTNIHNQDLSGEQRVVLRNSLKDDSEKARISPHSFCAFCGGDLNSVDADEVRFSTSDPSNINTSPNPSHKVKYWLQVLQGFTELKHTIPTHYDPKTKRMSRIDRLFVAMPSHSLHQCNILAGNYDEADRLYFCNLSDHAPTYRSFHLRLKVPTEQQAIPSWVAKSKVFREELERMTEKHHDPNLDLASRIADFNFCAKAAGRFARNRLLQQEESKPEALRQSLMTAARLVWRNDLDFFDRLRTSNDAVKEFVECEKTCWETTNHP